MSTKKTTGSHRPVGAAVLAERIEKLKAELAGVADEIAEVTRQRDAEVLDCKKAIDTAEDESERRKRQQEEQLTGIEAKERQGRALISSGEKLLREAKDARAETETMDLGQRGIAEARAALRTTIEKWAVELAKVQDSKTRRKRTMLEQAMAKLERRVERKAAEPPPAVGAVPVMPRNSGTPKPEPKPREKCKTCNGTGFVSGSCCPKCQGSMSVEVKDTARQGE